MVHKWKRWRGRDEHQRDLRQGGRCGYQCRIQQEHYRRGVQGRAEGKGPADGEWGEEWYVLGSFAMGKWDKTDLRMQLSSKTSTSLM